MGFFDGQTTQNKRFKGKTTYGYESAAQRNAAGAGEHAFRAGIFAVGGSGVGRESFMNSLGLLTKNQKREVSASGAGRLVKAQKWLIPGAAGLAAGETLLSGGNMTDYVGDYMLPEIGLIKGWHAGKNAGYSVASALGRTGKTLLAAGVLTGVATAAVGAASGLAVGYLASSATDSNNAIREFHENLSVASFNTEFEQNSGTLTGRQRAMSKLSKSALNDRGQLLGNEASVLAGVY